MISPHEASIVGRGPAALDSFRAAGQAAELAHVSGIDTEALAQGLGAGIAEDLQQDTEAIAAEIAAGRDQAFTLKALGLALDIFANRPGAPEDITFTSGETNLAKFLGISALARLRHNRHDIKATAEARPSGIPLDPVKTEAGTVQPEIKLVAAVEFSRPHRRDLKSPRLATQPYGPKGSFLPDDWGLERVEVAAKVELPVTRKEFETAGLPGVEASVDYTSRRGRSTFLTLQPGRTRENDPYYGWLTASPEQVQQTLDRLEALTSFAHRPGSRAVQDYRSQLR